jgi:predicted HD phosphohydrolase
MHFANVDTIFRSCCDIVKLAIEEVGTCETKSMYSPIRRPPRYLHYISATSHLHAMDSEYYSDAHQVIKHPQEFFGKNNEVPQKIFLEPQLYRPPS